MASNGQVKATDVDSRLLINGKFVEASDNGEFTLVSPYTRKPVCQVSEATEKDADAAVAAAKAAQPAWAARSFPERGAILKKWAELIRPEAQRLGQLDAISMGKPVSTFFDALAVDDLVTISEMGYAVQGRTSLTTAGQISMTFVQPYGVMAVIIPWNAPVLFFLRKVGAAVAVGNTVVLKTSEKSPLSCALLAKLTVDAGFPPGVINVLHGHGTPSGAVLAAHMDVRAISFTGSVATGKLIQQASAKSNLKHCIMELGGKSPAIVCEDADLDKAVADLAMSIGVWSGQICIASSRVYVQESIAEQFTAKYVELLGSAKAGDPLSPETTHGPQADEIQYNRVQKFIEGGKSAGGKVLLGGKAGKMEGQDGFFIAPTVFLGTPEEAEMMQNEIFGPVANLNTFKTDEEALLRANSTEYGLYSSIYTKDIDRAMKFAQGLEAGFVGVNCTSPNSATEMTIGGWKSSGQGREGVLQLETFMETKTVLIKS